jgi:hypothetical protein
MKKRILINTLLLMPLFFIAISLTRPDGAALVFGTFFLSLMGSGVSWAAWNLTYQPYHQRLDDTAQQTTQQADRNQSRTEKRKRETLDNVLRDLSDEQLDTLRQRLSDGTIDDDVLERRIVGTDGEYRYERT